MDGIADFFDDLLPRQFPIVQDGQAEPKHQENPQMPTPTPSSEASHAEINEKTKHTTNEEITKTTCWAKKFSLAVDNFEHRCRRCSTVNLFSARIPIVTLSVLVKNERSRFVCVPGAQSDFNRFGVAPLIVFPSGTGKRGPRWGKYLVEGYFVSGTDASKDVSSGGLDGNSGKPWRDLSWGLHRLEFVEFVARFSLCVNRGNFIGRGGKVIGDGSNSWPRLD